jgi:hypothetical protein
MHKDARQSASAADGMLGEMNKKFRATKETKDFLYVLLSCAMGHPRLIS